VVEAVIYQASGALLSFVLFGSVKHVKTYNQLRLTAQSLRMEKQQAELIYLKSRTNPHFLFNTLNSIFALARNKSDLTPESILRLSSILRFMLYETQAAFVAIEKEIKIISDYIALERLRYDETFRASFTYDIEDVNQLVPPLLLLPLVENAFKHGVSETEELPFLNIHLSLNQNELIFLVSNSTESAAREGPQMENIGLSTLRRRLELLFKDYSLSLKQGNAEFIATLKINLRESDKDDMYHH
jgi:LytS/YehU family sensor histidine kinase